MTNKKNVPAAENPVAGKNNSKEKSGGNKKNVSADSVSTQNKKYKNNKTKATEKTNTDKKVGNKRSTQEKKKVSDNEVNVKKGDNKNSSVKKKKHKKSLKKWLGSLNYRRIFLFIILPVVIIAGAIFLLTQSMIMNVPKEIRNAEYNGRIESELVALESAFNTQQQKVFEDSLQIIGNGDFSFYVNSVTHVGDDNKTYDLCFGNPSSNNCILIATIYDSKGNILYRSLGIEPGKEINTVTMFKDLDYGTHEVKFAVNAFDADSYVKLGTKYTKIKIAVGV